MPLGNFYLKIYIEFFKYFLKHSQHENTSDEKLKCD
jgi:hypothetical protein